MFYQKLNVIGEPSKKLLTMKSEEKNQHLVYQCSDF